MSLEKNFEASKEIVEKLEKIEKIKKFQRLLWLTLEQDRVITLQDIAKYNWKSQEAIWKDAKYFAWQAKQNNPNIKFSHQQNLNAAD